MESYIISSAGRDVEGRIITFKWQRVDGHNQSIGPPEIITHDSVIHAIEEGRVIYPGLSAVELEAGCIYA